MTAGRAVVSERTGLEARTAELYLTLDRMHAWRGWHWWPDADPFEVIVGSILVQNTMWTNVESALELLKAADALNPAAMSALSGEALETLVRPSGQYRQKAKKLRAFLETMEANGGLDGLLSRPAPELRAALLATWGIGPETADCIVVYAARQPALAIDAYTQRLLTRLGLGPGATTDYGEWQRWFLANLPASSPREGRIASRLLGAIPRPHRYSLQAPLPEDAPEVRRVCVVRDVPRFAECVARRITNRPSMVVTDFSRC